MKSLLMLVLMGAAGIAAGVAVFTLKPQPDAGADALMSRVRHLEYEVAGLRDRRPGPPTHVHWKRFERYFGSYENLALDRLPPDKVGRPGLGGEQWGGVVSGPVLDLLLAARIAQKLVPVYFDRVAVKDDTAQMTFYVLGAQED